MDEISKLTGRDYKLFNYYGAPDAEEVIVVMCSASEAVKETVDYLYKQGRKVGMVQIHLYRPFSVKHFAAAIPPRSRRSPCWTAPRRPAPWASPCTWTWSPP